MDYLAGFSHPNHLPWNFAAPALVDATAPHPDFQYALTAALSPTSTVPISQPDISQLKSTYLPDYTEFAYRRPVQRSAAANYHPYIRNQSQPKSNVAPTSSRARHFIPSSLATISSTPQAQSIASLPQNQTKQSARVLPSEKQRSSSSDTASTLSLVIDAEKKLIPANTVVNPRPDVVLKGRIDDISNHMYDFLSGLNPSPSTSQDPEKEWYPVNITYEILASRLRNTLKSMEEFKNQLSQPRQHNLHDAYKQRLSS